jgi:hypothetical protein
MKKFLFSLIIIVSCSSIEGFAQTPTPSTNFGTASSCCAANYTIGVSEATSINNKLPTIQFHTSGFQEAFLRLASDSRVFEIGDSQGFGVDFTIRNPANTLRSVYLSGRGTSYFNGGSIGIGTITPEANSIFHIDGGHGKTGMLLQLSSAANANNTGDIFLKTWVSEPLVSWEGTGIGANINNVGLKRFNNTLSSSYIRFVPNSTTGFMLFSTIGGDGTKYDNVMAIVNDKVGIGTTAPTEKLEVNGNLKVNGNLNVNGSIIYGNGLVRTETRNNSGLQGNAGALSGFFETSTPLNFPKDDSNWWHLIDSRHSNPANNYAMQLAGSFFDQKIYFRKTNNTPTQAWKEIIAMDATGKINLDNDVAGLKKPVTIGGYVYGGAIRFNANSAVANNRNLELGYSDNSGVFYPSVVVNAEGGNVGIGTTTPTGKFEISSSNGSAKFKIGDAAGNSINHLSWNTGAAINVPDQGGANPLIYFRRTDYNNLNNFTDVFQVKSDGSIEAFGQVRGSDMVSKGTNSWIFHTPDDGRKNMFIAPGLGASDGSAGWDWYKGVILNNDGSMGVGLSSGVQPVGYKLAVGGDVIAERVVVKLQANWPDYVFKTGYSLRPLSEVEAFVKTNNHLPDVPSEAEIKEKGIDMEQMNATLLKKVEELTLYLIEQQKEVKTLREEVKQLRDKK